MQTLFPKSKPAFSMLELIFVIVILGIISSLGSELIAKVFSNYIVQRGAHKSSSKTDLAATQIANRLSYAIPNTLIAITPGGTKEALDNLTDETATILQWTGSAHDSFDAGGWSGFADMDPSSHVIIRTPGSDLTLANTIVTNLTGFGLTISSALFFPRTYTTYNIGYGAGVDVASGEGITGLTKITGINTGATPHSFSVGSLNTDSKTIKEHYKLASSAYAIVPLKKDGTVCTVNDFPCDLVLRYNFQPWQGENYDHANASTKVLIRNVSAFRFTGSSDTIRFKLCQEEDIGEDNNITTCKEKAVIR